MSDHKSTQDLIGVIERKDRRFRIAQAIFMFATLLALVVVIGAQQRTLTAIKDQLDQAKSAQAAATKQSDDQRDKIIRRLDCIVVFFTLPNRANVTIDDIDKCSLNQNKAVQQFFQQPETTPAEKPPNLAPSSSSPAGTTAQPNQPQPTPTPATPPVPVIPSPPDPLRILGIPVCVPLTGLCIR